MTRPGKSLLRITLAALLGGVLGAAATRRRVRGLLGQGPWLSAAMKWSIGMMVAFSIYWTIAAKDQAPTHTSESVLSRQFHLWLINLALLMIMLPIPGLRWRLLPGTFSWHAAGLALQAASTLLAVWARRHLGTNWSGEVRIASGHRLVRTGPYAVVRHPIYTALAGMYAGMLLVSGELHALAGLLVIMLAYWRKIGLEERALGEAFADHADYRRSTWAWIPGLY
jgi:protein-S-isoprenylcysteine O-methyltransferase Ste14